jgi:hypothetical protein
MPLPWNQRPCREPYHGVADPTADLSLRMIGLGWCRQEHVHQDVDMPLWFDLGYTFPG